MDNELKICMSELASHLCVCNIVFVVGPEHIAGRAAPRRCSLLFPTVPLCRERNTTSFPAAVVQVLCGTFMYALDAPSFVSRSRKPTAKHRAMVIAIF